MICKNCGKNIEIENQKFCSECGAPLTVPALESNPLKTVEHTDATNILSETETRQVASSSDHSELIQPATKISFFNGIDAIIHSINAYEKLKPHAIDQSKLHNSFKQIVDMLVAGNSALTQFKQNNTCFDSVDENTINIGKCICNFQNNCNEVKSTISDSLNYDLIKKQGIFSFDFSLDPLSPFSMTIESPESNLDVTKFVEQILFSFINKDHKTKYRCIDLTANGSNFIHAHQLVKTTFELSGGKVYTTKRECTEIIDSLIKESATTVSTLGPISTLKEYNQNTTRKIDGLITIIFADQFNYNDDADKIRKLLKDSAKNGISFIIVGNKNLVKYFYDLSDYDIAYKNDTFFIDEDEYVSLVPSGTNTKPQANSATFEEDVIK